MSNEKRNWSSLSSGDIWDPKKEGDKEVQPTANSFIECVYLSKEENKGPKGNSRLYKVQVHVDGGKTVSPPKSMSFWGSTVLDDMMDAVAPGSYIRVKWLGMQKPKTATGSAFHGWDVAVDTSYVPAQGSAPVQQAQPVAAPVAQEDDDSLPF